MFDLMFPVLLTHLAPHLTVPSPLAAALGLTAIAPPAAFARVLFKMLLTVTVGPLVIDYVGQAVRFICRRPTDGRGELLVTSCGRAVTQDRRLPPGQRVRDDFDLVLLLAELVRLQNVAWMACGPLAAALVLPAALLLHARLATTRRGSCTVSGALSSVLGAATIPLPFGGHALGVRISGRNTALAT